MTKRKLKDLYSWDKNPRAIKKDKFEELKKRIQKHGQFKPLIITPEGEVLGGNMRLRAYKDLGIEDVWVSVVEPKNEAEKIEIALADNEEMGYYEPDALAELISQYKDELDLQNYSVHLEAPKSLDDLLSEYSPTEVEEDEAPEVEEGEPDSKVGEVYQLGRHRLMCGDSTKIEDVERLMNGQKADMVFTDPPYGMKKENEGVLNDNLNYADLLKFNKEWIPLTFSHLKENGSWYCWGIDEPLMDIYSEIIKPYIKENKATFRNLITWDKGHGQSQNSELTRSYATADEKCLFIMMGVQGFNNNSDNYFEGFESIRDYLINEREKLKMSTKDIIKIIGKTSASHYFSKSQWSFPTKEHYQSIRDYAGGLAFRKEYSKLKQEYDKLKQEYDKLKQEYYSTRAYFNNTHDNMNNVWHFDRTGNKEREGTGEHATPKPIALCSRAIKSSSRENEIVMDVFGGSGSTLIACEQTDRTCYMMELDPKYCDVIRKRYEKYKENN